MLQPSGNLASTPFAVAPEWKFCNDGFRPPRREIVEEQICSVVQACDAPGKIIPSMVYWLGNVGIKVSVKKYG